MHRTLEVDGKLQYAPHYDPKIGEAFSNVRCTHLVATHHQITSDMNLWAVWGAVKCPVLVIRGAKSDILPESVLDEMKSSTVPLSTVTYENCGHTPHFCHPETMQPLLDFFLQDK